MIYTNASNPITLPAHRAHFYNVLETEMVRLGMDRGHLQEFRETPMCLVPGTFDSFWMKRKSKPNTGV